MHFASITGRALRAFNYKGFDSCIAIGYHNELQLAEGSFAIQAGLTADRDEAFKHLVQLKKIPGGPLRTLTDLQPEDVGSVLEAYVTLNGWDAHITKQKFLPERAENDVAAKVGAITTWVSKWNVNNANSVLHLVKKGRLSYSGEGVKKAKNNRGFENHYADEFI